MTLRVSLWFLVAALGAGTAQDKHYFKVGGKLVLAPQAASGNMTSITWKSNGDMVAEWIEGKIPLEFFSRFKNHASLDLTTAVLSLSDMKPEHSGTYTVEINFQVRSRDYNVVELKAVPKPVVDVQPLSCNKETPNCTLVCGGDVSGTTPVTYFWKWDNMDWTESGDKLPITNNETTQQIEEYFCKIQNPVSAEESGPYKNVFYSPPSGHGPVIGGVVGFILVGVIVVAVWFTRDKWIPALGFRKETDSSKSSTDNGGGAREAQPLNDTANS